MLITTKDEIRRASRFGPLIAMLSNFNCLAHHSRCLTTAFRPISA